MNAESPDNRTPQDGSDSNRDKAYVTGSTKRDVPEWEQSDDQGFTTITSQMASAPETDEDKFIGRTIGDHYQILSLLGKGGMSVVYKARHTLLHQTMAVKFLLPERAIDPTLLSRFQIEAKAAFSLNHPNIARVNELGIEASEHPYIVMDFVEGQTLGDLIEENPGGVPVERALRLLCQACSGLEHAHGKNIVHRDIKPGNLILTMEGDKEVLKIVDFGIAKILHDTEGGQALTQTGEVFGSPLYMAPEQAMGKTLDARCDVYALGCVLYECLSGKPPFRGSNILDTLTKHINDDPVELSNVPVALQLIVKRAMQKEPGDRYQSMGEFRSDLEAYLGASDTKFVPTLQMLLKLKGNRKRLVSAAVAILILGGGIAWAVPALGPSPRFDHLTTVSWAWGLDPNPMAHKNSDAGTSSDGQSSNAGGSSGSNSGSSHSSSNSDGQSNADGQSASDGQNSSGDGSTTSDNQSGSSSADGQTTADGQSSSGDGQTIADNPSSGQGVNSDDKIAMTPSDDEDSATRSFDMKSLGKKKGAGAASRSLMSRGLTSDTSDLTRANLVNRMAHANEAFVQNNIQGARDEFQWCVDNWEKCNVSKSDWDYARAVSRLADCDRLSGKLADAGTQYNEAYKRWNDIAKVEKDKPAPGQDAKTLKAATRNAAVSALYIAYSDSAQKKALSEPASKAWDSLRDAFSDSKYLGVVRQDWSNVQWNLGNVVDAEVSRMMSLFDKVDPGKKTLEDLPLQKT